LKHLLHGVSFNDCLSIEVVLGNPVNIVDELTVSLQLALVNTAILLQQSAVLHLDSVNENVNEVEKQRLHFWECLFNLANLLDASLVFLIPDQNFETKSRDEEVLLGGIATLHDFPHALDCLS